MQQPTNSPGADDSDTPGLDAWLAIPLERWYREVAEANPERVRHDGVPCGERLLCDRAEHSKGSYPTVELLPSRALVLHCEGLTLKPNDPEYRARLAALGREGGS